MERLCSKTLSLRSFKMLSLIWVFVAFKGDFSTTLNIQTGTNEACSEEAMVSAIVEHHEDHSLAFLFSGHNVWSLNIEERELKQVERTSHVFTNVTEVIKAAGKDKFELGYFLLYGTDHGFNTSFSTDLTDVKTIVEMNRNLEVDDDSDLVCSANYLTDEETAVVIMMFKDGHIYRCEIRKNYQGSCSQQTSTPLELLNIPDLELKQCEGLLIDDVKRGVYNEEYRLLFATKDTLFYWTGDQLVYKLSLKALFGCSSTLIGFIIVTFVVIAIALTLILLVVIVFTLKERSKRLKHLTIHDSTTAITTQCMDRSRGLKQLPVSRSTSSKTSKNGAF